MDEREINERDIDDCINILGLGEYAFQRLEKMGEPALHRLFQILDGQVEGPRFWNWRDGTTERELALGRLGKLYPETLLALVRGRTDLGLSMIWALEVTKDPRLVAIAKEARKKLR